MRGRIARRLSPGCFEGLLLNVDVQHERPIRLLLRESCDEKPLADDGAFLAPRAALAATLLGLYDFGHPNRAV